MTPLPLWIRAAVQLRNVYSTRAARAVETALHERLAAYQRRLSLVGEALRSTAPTCSDTRLGPLTRPLRGLVQAVEQAVRPTASHWEKEQANLPDLRSVLSELRQLDDEFGGLDVNLKQKRLRVETERIVLEGVDLGPFAIDLDWASLLRQSNSSCLRIEALDACPASSNDDVSHPHVQNGSLCAGDATVPIQRALHEGRLADAFLLVRSVLLHYNPSSAYVALDAWDDDEGVDCNDCGYRTPDEDLFCCCRCGNDYCRDCMESCGGCDERICSSCLVRCGMCEEYYCPTCLGRCRFSRKSCCVSCQQACAGCGLIVARDRLDPESALCPSCVEKSEPTECASDEGSSPRSSSLSESEVSPTSELSHGAIPDLSISSPAAR